MKLKHLTIEEQQEFAIANIEFVKKHYKIEGVSLDDLRQYIQIIPKKREGDLALVAEANFDNIPNNTIYYCGRKNRVDDLISHMSNAEVQKCQDPNGNEMYKLFYAWKSKELRREKLRGYITLRALIEIKSAIEGHIVRIN